MVESETLDVRFTFCSNPVRMIHRSNYPTLRHKTSKTGLLLASLLLGPTWMTLAAGLPVTNGLCLWLAADFGVTTNAAGLVSVWADQSGAGHSASQSSFGSQPSLLPNQLNGQPVVRFIGGKFFALAGQIITSPQFTIVAVVCDQRTDTNFRELISNWNSATGNQGTSVFFGTTGRNPVRARFTDSFGGADQGQTGVGILSSPSNYFVFTAVSGANMVAVYQNTTNIAFRNTPLTARNLTGDYVLGRQGNGTFDEYWRGDIAEMLVFNRELSLSELEQVWSFLLLKYLPASYPPLLSIAPQAGSALISFVVARPTNYFLQVSETLVPGQWSDLALFPYPGWLSNVVVTYSTTNAPRFFRLRLGL